METEHTNLVAYIPVLNHRHIEWFARHPESTLHLISQELAEELDPRQKRNMGAVPTHKMHLLITALSAVNEVYIINNGHIIDYWTQFILADEDICHLLVEKFWKNRSISHHFEDIKARYDMTAVKRQSPVMPDVEIDDNPLHWLRMEKAREAAKQTPDWWRQIGAAIFHEGECLATACNNHYPTEYVTDIFSDPRLTVDAGQKGKYVSLHAEETVIVQCAREGISTKGVSLYSTVFPCENCARVIAQAGVSKLFFEEGYSALDALEVLQGFGVKIIQIKKNP